MIRSPYWKNVRFHFFNPQKVAVAKSWFNSHLCKKNPNPAGRIQVVGWLVQAPHGIFTSEKGTERRHTLSNNPNGLKVFIEFFHLGRTCLDQFFFQAKLLGLGSARFGSGAAVMTQRS
jgi:hypothetical protein